MIKKKLKYDKSLYISIDPFESGRETDIRLKNVKIVKARKKHSCAIDGHIINKGDEYRRETALVDDSFAECCVCMPCMDNFIKNIGA